MVTPTPQLLDDGWSNQIDDVARADKRDDFTQLFDEAGLHFDEPGGNLVSSGVGIVPKR